MGYVVVAVKENAIIKSTPQSVDRFGHELVMLKEHSIQAENILEFVHANKKHYSYQNHLLTQIPTV